MYTITRTLYSSSRFFYFSLLLTLSSSFYAPLSGWIHLLRHFISLKKRICIYFTLFLYLRKVGLWFLSFALPFIGTAFPFPHSHSITLFALHFYPPLWMFKFEGVEYCVFRANNPFVEQTQQLCMEHIDVLGSVPEFDWNWNSDSVELRTIGFNELWMWI